MVLVGLLLMMSPLLFKNSGDGLGNLIDILGLPLMVFGLLFVLAELLSGAGRAHPEK